MVPAPGSPSLWRWAVVLAPGAALWFLPLLGLSGPQRHLLAIFVATILALIAQPVPMGVSVVIAMTVLALTRTLPPAKVLSGFSNVTVWLIFTAFLFARSVSATGFGNRVGYLFIKRFARSPLTLGYSIAGANVVLAPFIPSDTARGGGIIFPRQQINISYPLDERVISVLVKAGDQVSPKQPLIQLDPSQLNAQVQQALTAAVQAGLGVDNLTLPVTAGNGDRYLIHVLPLSSGAAYIMIVTSVCAPSRPTATGSARSLGKPKMNEPSTWTPC